MELERRLFTLDGKGTGVAFGDRVIARFEPFGGRTVVPPLIPVMSLAKDAFESPRGFVVVDLLAIEEREVDREKRVDVSDGVLLPLGGILSKERS